MLEEEINFHRIVHFDLKGAVPRLSYLEQILQLISSWGATGILLEYEDSFPFQDDLKVLQSSSAFTTNQISDIKSICARNNLMIIPLIQTFGHLEFLLKHDKFRHLREVDRYPNAVCPTNPETETVVMDLIDQVLQQHPGSSYLHIGADEVWHLGQCERCKRELKLKCWTTTDLYLHWVSSVARKVKLKYPTVKIIMWDDMMRVVTFSKLKDFQMGDLVEPMIWKYESKQFSFPTGMFDNFSQVFDTIWAASCYKGASGSTQFLPPIQHHIDNQLSWLALIQEQRKNFKRIQGLVLTGWQRYDHYAVLCELLPTAVPSLALCLKVVSRGSFTQEDHEVVSKNLGFQNIINVFPFPRPQVLEQGMTFPGWEIHLSLQMWSNFVYRFQMICNSEAMLGWFSDYFRSKNFTNPAQVEIILIQTLELEKNMLELKSQMKNSMLEVYYEDTWEEWSGCFFVPILKRLQTIAADCQGQIDAGARVRDWKPPDNDPERDEQAQNMN